MSFRRTQNLVLILGKIITSNEKSPVIMFTATTSYIEAHSTQTNEAVYL